MNEDSWTEQTGKVEKIGWGFIRWTIYAVITVCILGGVFWVFFYSDYLANNYSVILARNWYQDSYRKIENLPIVAPANTPGPNPIYTIQAQKPLENGLNTYTFSGTFAKIDMDKNLIYLLSKDGNRYIFRIDSVVLQREEGLWLNIAKVPNISSLSTGALVSPTTNSTIPNLIKDYKQILVTDNNPSSPLAILGFRWNDRRTLVQIEQDYSKNKDLPLNNDSPESSILAEFK